MGSEYFEAVKKPHSDCHKTPCGTKNYPKEVEKDSCQSQWNTNTSAVWPWSVLLPYIDNFGDKARTNAMSDRLEH